jgi:NADPH2:quinone reductase
MAHSTTVAGMWLPHIFRLPGDVMATALAELFAMVGNGTLQVVEGGDYALADARKAHEDMRARRTTGKLTLDPTR